jgi:hypothetical protein
MIILKYLSEKFLEEDANERRKSSELWLRSDYFSLTPLSKLLEKLTGLQPVKKFPAFYGIQTFITAFTNARHLSLS